MRYEETLEEICSSGANVTIVGTHFTEEFSEINRKFLNNKFVFAGKSIVSWKDMTSFINNQKDKIKGRNMVFIGHPDQYVLEHLKEYNDVGISLWFYFEEPDDLTPMSEQICQYKIMLKKGKIVGIVSKNAPNGVIVKIDSEKMEVV